MFHQIKISLIPLCPAIFLLFFAIACDPVVTKNNKNELVATRDSLPGRQKSSLTIVMQLDNPAISDYMEHYLRSELMQRYGITLKLSGGQPASVFRLLKTGQGGKPGQSIDLFWLNDENLLKFIEAGFLSGPILDSLPNAAFLNRNNPQLLTCRQQNIGGMVVPWGLEQLTFYYDADKVKVFPSNPAALKDYLKANPGTFTFPSNPTGYDFLETLLIGFAKSANIDISGDFAEEKYKKSSALLWAYLDEIRPYLWKDGVNFPRQNEIQNLFQAGTLHFVVGRNALEGDYLLYKSGFPKSVKIGNWEGGTLQKSHYIGISKQSTDRKAALVFCNFLLSPEAQLRKYDPRFWGEETVLDPEKLSAEQKSAFLQHPARKLIPSQNTALPALALEYRLRLMRDLHLYVK